MTYFGGLDVSMEETWLCVVDEAGAVLIDRSVPSTPAAIASVIELEGFGGAQLGLEAGALSPWLYHELSVFGFDVICFEILRAIALPSGDATFVAACANRSLQEASPTGPGSGQACRPSPRATRTCPSRAAC